MSPLVHMARLLPRIAGFALTLMLLTGLIVLMTQKTANIPFIIADIAVEHAQPLTIRLRVTRNRLLRLIELGHDAHSTIAISLPEEWQRGEVRGVPLSAVTSEPPSLGFRRWQIPAGAVVLFHSRSGFTNVRIHNPSGIPLKIRFTETDIEKNSSDHEVYLMKQDDLVIP